ncbi:MULTISPECIES: hypothetical protein [Mycobacteriaceae]|uniref:Uncharacterized protein n=1 Tax=Mycolicibacterium parafortuitum TaxID=39692 RepID=A0ACC6MQ04_MYCPF|nr:MULTISPECIES: hypothetical protein [Mycobacteriaceae]MDZ5089101.1 hypothetical protein [Mycolicibacterium parafortuitum]
MQHGDDDFPNQKRMRADFFDPGRIDDDADSNDRFRHDLLRPRSRRSLGFTGASLAAATLSLATSPASAAQDLASSQILVDELGATDDERLAMLNRLARETGGQGAQTFVLSNRIYQTSTPIRLYSGLKIIGTSGQPAREYNGGTTIRWDGKPNTSIFEFPTDDRRRGNYPADGSPRDITLSGILFEGGQHGSDTDVFPKLDMTSASIRGQTLWYCTLHNLAVRDMRTFWWGYGTGVSLTGTFHGQAMHETPFFIGGSENTIFGTEAQSFLDNNSPAWKSSTKPFLRSVMQKSYIGRCIITARRNAHHISVEGGRGLFISGVQFDAPNTDPTNGSAIKVTRVEGLSITNCVFYASMNRPKSGRGIIDISGGQEITISDNQFIKYRRSMDEPLSDTPIVFSSAATPVKIGLNNYVGYSGVILGSAQSIDPSVRVHPI